MPPRKGSKRARASNDDDTSDVASSAAAAQADEQPVRRAKGSSKQKADKDDADDVAASSAAAAPSRQARSTKKGKASSSSSSSAAAGSASSSPSPAVRCDVDSVSVVLSFLNSTDFLSAIRASRAWRGARMKHTAWPRQHIPLLLHRAWAANDNDEAENAGRRRLVIDLSAHETHTRRSRDDPKVTSRIYGGEVSISSPALALMDPSSMWRHASEVQICGESHFRTDRESNVAAEHAVLGMAEMPYLQSICLRGASNDEAGCTALYAAVASRLEALTVTKSPRAFGDCIAPLTQLRILVLDMIPSPVHLVSLVKLEHLHMEGYCWAAADAAAMLGPTLRYMSQKLALRSLSLEYSKSFEKCSMETLFAPAGTAVAAREVSPFELFNGPSPGIKELPQPDMSVSAGFTALHFSASTADQWMQWCVQLPLRKLNLQGWRAAYTPPGTLTTVDAPCLRTLQHVRVDPFLKPQRFGWAHLEGCTSLVSLHLAPTTQARQPVQAQQLAQVIHASRMTLEELSISDMRILQTSAGEAASSSDASAAAAAAASSSSADASTPAVADLISALASCTRVRTLRMSLESSTPDAFWTALGSLPAFVSLELELQSKEFDFPPALIAALNASQSVCSVHLYLWTQSHIDLLRGARGLNVQLPVTQLVERLLTRLRVYAHKDGAQRCFAVREDAKGTATWVREF